MGPYDYHMMAIGSLFWGMGLPKPTLSYLWLARNEGMEKKVETTIMGYIGTTIAIHSMFIP